MRYGLFGNKGAEIVSVADVTRTEIVPSNHAIAMFPVNDAYSYKEQLQRAAEYRDYLNERQRATEEAAKTVTLHTAAVQRMTTK